MAMDAKHRCSRCTNGLAEVGRAAPFCDSCFEALMLESRELDKRQLELLRGEIERRRARPRSEPPARDPISTSVR
jgi:hypothetical protein